MDERKYTLLADVLGRWKADIIENLLTSEGIQVLLSQETVSDLFTTAFSPVKIFVPQESLVQARKLLERFEKTQN